MKLACLAAVSMLVVSCGGGADYRNLLPADSFMTMSVNPASLLQKSDAGDIGQHPLFIRLKAELDKAEGITAEEKEYLLALLKNPCESGVDLKKDLDKRPAARQFRQSILQYMASDRFNPSTTLDPEKVRALYKKAQ